MKVIDVCEIVDSPDGVERAASDANVALDDGCTPNATGPTLVGVLVGELVGLGDDGRTPMVIFPGQPGTRALKARSTVDLHGAYIGKQIVLSFERGALTSPIVMGVLRQYEELPQTDRTSTVDLDADGNRLIVSAKDQLVLRCGRASITLTKAGKVLIQGVYVLSRSSGVNRIKGGSVQLN